MGVDMTPLPLSGVDIETVPAASDPKFVSALLAMAHRHYAALVVPTVSEELPILSSFAATYSGDVGIVIASPQAVGVADDKRRTVQMLTRAGIAVPRSACRAHCLRRGRAPSWASGT